MFVREIWCFFIFKKLFRCGRVIHISLNNAFISHVPMTFYVRCKRSDQSYPICEQLNSELNESTKMFVDWVLAAQLRRH